MISQGPGEVSIKSFIPIAAELSNIVGTNYDLVAFDNRGIGYSLPLANCSTGVSSSSINEPKSNQAPPKNNKAIPEFANVFYEDDLILAQAIGKACEAQIGGKSLNVFYSDFDPWLHGLLGGIAVTSRPSA